MFVSIVCEFSGEDHQKAVNELLTQYGFRKVMKDCYESVTIKENALTRLKRDIDRRTDYYDKIRFFQYPLEETLIITFLSNKKWRKTIVNL